MFMRVLLFITALLAVYTSALELSADTFEKDVIRSEEVWLVEFYSPMCGSCSEFAPNWNKIEKSMKSSIKLGKINIDVEENMELAEEFGVLAEGLPNVRLFAKHEMIRGQSIPIDENVGSQYKKLVDAVNRGLFTNGAKVDEDTGLYIKYRPQY